MKADSSAEADEPALAAKGIFPVAPCLQYHYSHIKIQQGKIVKQSEADIAERQRVKRRKIFKKTWSDRALKIEQLLLGALISPHLSGEVLRTTAPTVTNGVQLQLGSGDLTVHSISGENSSTQIAKLGIKATESKKR